MIKGVTSEKLVEEVTYPYVGKKKDRGLIVLFTGLTRGFVIEPGTTINEKGDFSSSWAEENFTKINCTVEFD